MTLASFQYLKSNYRNHPVKTHLTPLNPRIIVQMVMGLSHF